MPAKGTKKGKSPYCKHGRYVKKSDRPATKQHLPCRPDYQYRVRPAQLVVRNRSDGHGARHPIKVQIDDDLQLDIFDAKGRQLDGRLRISREARKILYQLVQELGGPEQITFKQRLQLEVVVRRTLIGRGLFASGLKGETRLDPQVPINNDRTLLAALDKVYA